MTAARAANRCPVSQFIGWKSRKFRLRDPWKVDDGGGGGRAVDCSQSPIIPSDALFFFCFCFLSFFGSTTEIEGEGMIAGYSGGSSDTRGGPGSDNRSKIPFSVLEVFLTDFWDVIKGILTILRSPSFGILNLGQNRSKNKLNFKI